MDLVKYAQAYTFTVPLPKVDGDFAAAADWTPAAGDVKVSKDGGAVANIGTLPSAVTGTGSVLWSFTLSAAELTAKQVTIQIVDAALQNQAIRLGTYGHASALVPEILDVAAAVAALDEIKAVRSFAAGRFVIDTDARTVVFYAADGTTPLHTWQLSADFKERTVS